ncbi:MAG: zinc ribbon domain-containing protein, partial [candidate division Zixibacteria bacterium]|nr:zinc ribbon domain-containing protein [candidate division Zixibacteria bacterium]
MCNYLLSGLIHCGKCNAKMIGSSAKSGQHFYYACQNYSKRGKSVCNAKLINKKEIENILIDRIKTHVLTEKNLTELLNIVIDELNQSNKGFENKLKSIDMQLNVHHNKLDKLYSSLETGKLDIDDIAPRIKELRKQTDKFNLKRNEIQDEIQNPTFIPFDLKMLKHYVKDLADLLNKGSIIERKSFLRSFIKRIVVNHPEVRIDYKLPIINEKDRNPESEVLSIIKLAPR